MKESAGVLLARYEPLEFRPPTNASVIDYPKPGVVILARDNADGSSTLVTSLYARRDAGSVGTSLLHVQAAAGKTAYFIFIVPVDKFYEGARIQMEFHAACEVESGLSAHLR